MVRLIFLRHNVSPPHTPDYIIYYNWIQPFQQFQTTSLKRINICSFLFCWFVFFLFSLNFKRSGFSWNYSDLLRCQLFSFLASCRFSTSLCFFSSLFNFSDMFYDFFNFVQCFFITNKNIITWTKHLDSDCYCFLSRFNFVSFIFLFILSK